MPSATPCLSAGDALRWVHSQVLEPSNGNHAGHRVGIELEWLTNSTHEADGRPKPADLHGQLTAVSLPANGRVTFEPGGQVELSTRAHPSLATAIIAAETDAVALRARLAALGVATDGCGFDASRTPRRVLELPRYEAMEAYFDTLGTAGRTMMCNTAAIQVNVDLGPDPDTAAARWRLAHAAGPTLAAAFANSPLSANRPSGWKSTRLATWAEIDATRTAPVGGADPVITWGEYALAARVMFVQTTPDHFVPLTGPPMSLAQWLQHGHELGWPTEDDIAYHLTTLFPPLRPRRWLEIRMVDALPDPWWRVAAAVTVAVLYSPDASAATTEAVARSGAVGRWAEAARYGLDHPALGLAAGALFQAVLEVLPDFAVDAVTADAVGAYYERFVERSRCPADDLLAMEKLAL